MRATPPDEDADLLGGEGDAFAAFYRRYERPVLQFFLRRAASAELASDLAAETFARALEGRGRFDPARGTAAGWLFGIARHLLAASAEQGYVEDQTRRRLGMEPIVLDDDAIARIDALCDLPALHALNELPTPIRDAVLGRVVDEQSYTHLASRMACSEMVVRQRVSRGLRALRAQLKAER